MLILAVDSATPVAGVALLNEDKLIREEFVNYKKNHSETLMPMIDEVLSECGCTLQDLSAVAVTVGPGSFTGLRIGLATVKGLSMAMGKPVIAISTLDVLAHNIILSNALVCPLLDARKQEVYAALYDVLDLVPQRLVEEMACSPGNLVELIRETAIRLGKERIIMLGDGFYPYKDFFRQQLGQKLQIAPHHLMLPRAAALGSLAVKKYERQDFEDAFNLRPRYIRLSEAEYKLGKGEQ